jgi:cell division protein FtsB
MFLTILTFLSAISISVIAAGYSIIGLATLFAGAVIPIIAMGSALEVGKLVAASWLYNNWKSDVPRLLKAYLFGAIIILIFITSMGIFGFLSKAHLDQVKPTSSNNIKIELLDNQIKSQQLIINRSQKTLDQLDKALEVYIEKEYVTRGLKERKKQKPERDELNLAIKEASNEIAKLSEEKGTLNLEQDKIEAEVGPIKYVAELIYGENAENNFDSAVRIVILILIFVFDPLAVLLLIAANISLRQWRMKRSLTTVNKEDELEKKVERLQKRNDNLRDKERDYKGFIQKLGAKELSELDPDEIKIKLDQVMDWNDKIK